MKQKTTRNIFIGLLAIAVGVVFYFGVLNTMLNDSTGYKTITYEGNKIIYSNAVGLDYNSIKTNHQFLAWKDGTATSFNSFSANPGLVNFYLLAGLNINPSDFSGLPTDGDCLPASKTMKVEYCKVPTELNIEKTYTDADGCPHYKIMSSNVKRSCVCAQGKKACVGEQDYGMVSSCFYGAMFCQVTDCSEYDTTITNNDFGGTIDGKPRGYKAILEGNGWTLGQEGFTQIGSSNIRCGEYSYIWDWSGVIKTETMNSIADKYSCEIKGTATTCSNNVDCSGSEIYSIKGKVFWEGSNGFNCQVNPGEFYDKKIVTGQVIFSPRQKITVYNLVNNSCTTKEIYDNEITDKDLTQAVCNTKILILKENIIVTQTDDGKECKANIDCKCGYGQTTTCFTGKCVCEGVIKTEIISNKDFAKIIIQNSIFQMIGIALVLVLVFFIFARKKARKKD